MKKHSAYKSVQLALFLVLAAVAIARIFADRNLYHQVAADPATRLLCIILWAVLGLSFLFIFLDFHYFLVYRKDYRELDYAVHSDPVSGIANRFSCDLIVEKYLDKPLPQNMGCIMMDITNIREINRLYGHLQGNMVISDFSSILTVAAEGLCFVGRNGGNKFLALFEDTSEEEMELFLGRVKEKVGVHNAGVQNGTIEYRWGSAFHEGAEIQEITQLIALSNSRIPQNPIQTAARQTSPADQAAE